MLELLGDVLDLLHILRAAFHCPFLEERPGGLGLLRLRISRKLLEGLARLKLLDRRFDLAMVDLVEFIVCHLHLAVSVIQILLLDKVVLFDESGVDHLLLG